MFDHAPIDKKEALELCLQMLTALAALPVCSDQLEYKTTYEVMLRSLEGHVPFILILPNSGASALQQTHTFALSVLRSGREAKGLSWLREILHHRQGW